MQRLPTPDGTTRYRLLETMRAYGHERLVENGTADAVRLRHVEHLAEVIDSQGSTYSVRTRRRSGVESRRTPPTC